MNIVRKTIFLALIGSLFVSNSTKIFATDKNQPDTMVVANNHPFVKIFNLATLYIGGGHLSHWKQGEAVTADELKQQYELFNYNLRIEHIIDENKSHVIKQKRPTLYLHGWRDWKNSGKILKGLGDVLPGEMVTFNFEDNSVFIPRFKQTNLAQLKDILPALYTLKWMNDHLQPEAINLFGYSRGGATAINLIAVLNDKTYKYNADLLRIGINKAERKELLALIQKGSHTLNCPMISPEATIEYRFPKWVQPVTNFFTTFSSYDPKDIQAINSVNTFDDLQLKMLVHFQYPDRVIGNKNDKLFFERLAKHNPEHTYAVFGADGGHIHTHRALSQTVHKFREKYNESYDPAYLINYKPIFNSYEGRLLTIDKAASGFESMRTQYC